MGSTIAAINGAKECAIQQDGTVLNNAGAIHSEGAQKRFCFYAWFYAAYSKDLGNPKGLLPFDKADQVCITNLAEKCSDQLSVWR